VCKRCGFVSGSTPFLKYCDKGDEPQGKNSHEFVKGA